jgi:hydroxycarboxylate dehydrogenase B
MPIFTAPELKQFSSSIFVAAGASPEDASTVADSLVEANLAGHDSHGVMRVTEYVSWMEQGTINLAAKPYIAESTSSLSVLDGDWGWGQVIGRWAVDVAAEKASAEGASTVFCRNSCHLGRIGEYPERLARRGIASVMFVNTHGAGRLVAPWGGIERRLSANPIGIGVPREGGPPIIVDISTCAMAEGKLRNFLTAGQSLPPGCIVDAEGHPSTNPADFYGPPPGALLAFGGHKGFALGLAADILAGALSGAGCSRPEATRVGNSFMLVAIDVAHVRGTSDFASDVLGLVEFVKSSRSAEGHTEILMPGDPEHKARENRQSGGIPIHSAIWAKVLETAGRKGVKVPERLRNV